MRKVPRNICGIFQTGINDKLENQDMVMHKCDLSVCPKDG